MKPVHGLPVDAEWDGVDSKDWRDLPDADGELENDEDAPAPEYVVEVLGFDPDDEDWE